MQTCDQCEKYNDKNFCAECGNKNNNIQNKLANIFSSIPRNTWYDIFGILLKIPTHILHKILDLLLSQRDADNNKVRRIGTKKEKKLKLKRIKNYI